MHRWFVAFSYRVNPEAPVKFGNLVCSTPEKLFCYSLVAQRIANENNYSDVQIINWKLMNELEFLAHEQWIVETQAQKEREVEEFEGRL